jgi:hypothetical protein
MIHDGKHNAEAQRPEEDKKRRGKTLYLLC